MLAVRNMTRASLPAFSFAACAKRILGPDYVLSVVCIGDRRARSLNERTRGKTYAANVLSFALESDTGELFINLAAAKRESKKLGVSFRDRTAFLFIHACLHLKGYAHGGTMDAAQEKWCKRFSVSQTQ